ncbi:nitrous oxide reductase family maturation protein NosD [Flavobacterium sp. NKUCC04_CG]|nr:nitrous oxide reductase family maturation protein NosD [Flavobacterium sp. NKUCC04_CG]MBW3519453.1 nitrous oxide reductase family maturation protein NosD [Flavobacterium sp. NKUCC04_CG]
MTIFSKTIEVGPNCKHTNLQEAIKTAKAYDTIIVKKGTYREVEIRIDKALTITAETGAIIDGEEKGEIIIITADDVVVDGFTIINVGTSYIKDYAAIRVRGSKNFVISNNLIKNLFFGIYIEKSKNGRIVHNKIYGKALNEFNSGNGIQLWYSNQIEIDNNLVLQVRDGIYLEFSNYCTITNNQSMKNVRYGLHFMFSNNDFVRGNTFDNNGAGVAIMFSKDMKMSHNTFKNNWGSAAYGVLLKEVNDTKIHNNLFYKNTTGINIEGSNRVAYYNNDFTSNGWAINSRGANYYNKINHNNFMHNSFDVVYHGGLNHNSFNSNYWSNYTGYDLNKDGIGDVPYRPVKLFSYIVNRTPEAILFLRSLFVDIIDFSEKVSPVFTPDHLTDAEPLMKKIKHD